MSAQRSLYEHVHHFVPPFPGPDVRATCNRTAEAPRPNTPQSARHVAIMSPPRLAPCSAERSGAPCIGFRLSFLMSSEAGIGNAAAAGAWTLRTREYSHPAIGIVAPARLQRISSAWKRPPVQATAAASTVYLLAARGEGSGAVGVRRGGNCAALLLAGCENHSYRPSCRIAALANTLGSTNQ